jgi:hypothetical protein
VPNDTKPTASAASVIAARGRLKACLCMVSPFTWDGGVGFAAL